MPSFQHAAPGIWTAFSTARYHKMLLVQQQRLWEKAVQFRGNTWWLRWNYFSFRKWLQHYEKWKLAAIDITFYGRTAQSTCYFLRKKSFGDHCYQVLSVDRIWLIRALAWKRQHTNIWSSHSSTSNCIGRMYWIRQY